MRTPQTPLTLARDGLLRILQMAAFYATPRTPEGRPASITYVTKEDSRAA